MKKIFIYYSSTGNGDLVSKYLEKEYDIRKVNTLEPLPKSYFFSILIGGYKAMRNYKDKLDNFDSDISSYDEVLIGSPIWNDRLCSVINSVLEKIDLTNKKVGFVLYSGSGKAGKASKLINEKYKTVPIILKEPKKNKDELKKLEVLL